MKRSSNGVFLGVCAGLAQECKLDAGLVRALFLLTTLLGGGLPILIYLVLAVVLEKE